MPNTTEKHLGAISVSQPKDTIAGETGGPSLTNQTTANVSLEAPRNVVSTGSANPFTYADQSTEVEDSSTFVSYGKKVVKIYDRTSDQREVLQLLHPPSEALHTIKTFLSRPALVHSGFLPQNRDTVFSIDILPTLSKIKMYADKLQGFYGFRAKANLKLVTNAQPYDMGLLLMSYIPFYETRQDMIETFKHPGLITWLTSVPSTTINISTQSETVLSADYTGPNAFVNLTNPYMRWGTFVLTTLTNIQRLDANSSSVPYSAYLYLTDIETYGVAPTGAVDYQGDEPCFTKKDQLKEALLVNAGNAATSLVSEIPELLLAGLSKPPQDQRVARRELQPFGNPQLLDGTSNAIKLSASSTQAVDIKPLGLDDVDEMDIQHIVSKPTYYSTFTWKVGDSPGTKLFFTPVEPNVARDAGSRSLTGATSYVPNRVHGVANMFDFWRGGITYTFHVAATNFHSGRIAIVYAPGTEETDSAGVYDAKQGSYYAIWDLRKGSTFSVTCPYIGSTAWKRTPKYDLRPTESYIFRTRDLALQQHSDPMNSLFVFVETHLQNPSMTGSVEVVVYVSGAEDFEVAAPAAPRNIILMNGIDTDVPHFQSEDVEDVPRLTITAGGQARPSPMALATRVTMGEQIRSLRALIKRYHLIATGGFAKNSVTTFAPWCFRGGSLNKGKPLVIPCDSFHIIQSCYAFYRGGMRMMFHTSPGAEKDLHLTYRTELNHDAYDTNGSIIHTYGYETEGLNGGLGMNAVYGTVQYKGKRLDTQAHNIQEGFPSEVYLPIVQTVTGGIEVEVPYYARTHKSIVHFYDNESLVTVANDETKDMIPSGFVSLRNNSDSSVVVRVLRAAADDYNLGFFLGFPVHVTNVTVYYSLGMQEVPSQE